MSKKLKNFIGGSWVSASSAEAFEIINPADGETKEFEVNYSNEEDVAIAVKAASEAFISWKETPMMKRCRILFNCKALLEIHVDKLAEILVKENGKTLGEAQGDIRRGIEVVEFAAGMPSLSKGDFIENIAGRVDGFIYREPLGVVTGACPFNFPAMIPMWMFPVAIALGNTFVLKPSEKCPATATRLVEIFQEGGLPDGVLNLVHGDKKTFEALIKAPEVRAVSFVGSTPAAKSVYELATSHHKRAQSLGGAKNYIVVLPDAEPKQTLSAIIGSTYGCAGERCMASSVLVAVGDTEKIIDSLVSAAKDLKMGYGLDALTQMGPVVSKEHKEKIEEYIKIGIEEGATLLVDGREHEVEGEGYFIGPTIFDHVTSNMRIAKEEIFGPVLSIMRSQNLTEAIELANKSDFGNGASIFTESGAAAREFRNRVECGMIGVNSGVPAPMAFFSFGGHKNSIFGDLRAHGPDSVEFYTQKKAVIERWNTGGETGSIWAK